MPDPELLKSVQVTMEEPEASRQSRLCAWEALKKIGSTLSDLGPLTSGKGGCGARRGPRRQKV
jgi:hypothetical protein